MTERISQINVTTVRLSSELKCDADRVRDFAADIMTNALTPGQIADRLRMLGTTLDRRSNRARGYEECIEVEQEARRHG